MKYMWIKFLLWLSFFFYLKAKIDFYHCTFYFTATEIANTKRRTEAGAWINITSGTAHTVYAGIAYFARGWRTLQLIIGLLPLPLILLYFVLPETPRFYVLNYIVWVIKSMAYLLIKFEIVDFNLYKYYIFFFLIMYVQ